MNAAPLLDLRDCKSAHLSGALLARLRALAPGDALRICSREDPEWALRSADLHLQHRLHWRCWRAADRTWSATVRCIAGGDTDGLVGVLLRDHRRLDTLLARVLAALNDAEVASGAALFATVAQALNRHMALEDEVLAPQFMRHAPASAQPVQAMHVEHREISMHLNALATSLAHGSAEIGEASILCGMLCGLIAKHEHREEMSLLPLWQAAWVRLQGHEREDLAREARNRLGLA